MEVRVGALFILFSVAMYFFITYFRSITHKQWTSTGKILVKVAVSVVFALTMIATCGIISRLSN